MKKRLPTNEQPAGNGGLCQASVLTPRGRGAIATIVVCGRDARRMVSKLFRPAAAASLDQTALSRVVFGRWVGHDAPADSPAEELVVCCRSFEQVEVHCHGGTAAADNILAALGAQGCPTVEADRWVAATQPDRLVADALLSLANARTTRTAAVLLDQYRGALSRAVTQVAQDIAAGRTAAACAMLDSMQHWSTLGGRLDQPWRLVLAGRTNAGKSSLINALLGYQRALVDRQAGTTRDVLTAVTAIDGWPAQLADTAGWHDGAHELESAGIARAKEQVAAADLVLLVSDASEPWTRDDQQWAAAVAADKILHVHNKIDLVDSGPADRPAGTSVSARNGVGLERLIAAIARRIVPTPPPPGAPVPFQEHHRQAIARARDALAASDAARARQLLDDLLGKH